MKYDRPEYLVLDGSLGEISLYVHSFFNKVPYLGSRTCIFDTDKIRHTLSLLLQIHSIAWRPLPPPSSRNSISAVTTA